MTGGVGECLSNPKTPGIGREGPYTRRAASNGGRRVVCCFSAKFHVIDSDAQNQEVSLHRPPDYLVDGVLLQTTGLGRSGPPTRPALRHRPRPRTRQAMTMGQLNSPRLAPQMQIRPPLRWGLA